MANVAELRTTAADLESVVENPICILPRQEAVAFEAVGFVYPDGTRALRDITLSVPTGQRVAIIGQNGSGKSTLVRHLNGLLRPTEGRVFVEGRDTKGRHVARLAALGLPWLAAPPLGSVGVHAVHAARRLGPGPVLAAGLDFAYERGKTHARGAPALQAEERRQTRLCRFPGQLGAAFKPGARPAAPGSALLTDPVLTAYAALLAEEAAAPGPLLLDLRGRGLAIGGRAATYAEAAALLDAARGPRPADPARGAAPAPGAATAADIGAAFIAEEGLRLSRLVAALKGRESLDGRAFLELVAGSDYLLWPFPDAHRLRALPQDLLNRLLVEAEYWRWKLGDIVSGGDSG